MTRNRVISTVAEFCEQHGNMKEDYLDVYESTMTDADKVNRGIKRSKPDGNAVALSGFWEDSELVLDL